MTLKMAGRAGIEKDSGEMVRVCVVGKEPRSMGPKHAVDDKGAEVAEGNRDSRGRLRAD
jgi:hypothetical protein